VAGPATRINIRRITLGDAWEAGDVLSRSHADYPAFRHFFPDTRRRRRVIGALMTAAAEDVARRGDGYLARIRGLVVGAALWFAPESPERSAWASTRLAATTMPALLSGRRRFLTLARVGAALEREASQEEGWYLQVMGIDPRQQRRGIGARLMAPVLEAADARGLTCGLHTSDPANAAFYERLGFVVIDPLHPILSGGPSYLRMRRQPQ
jgi:ribosomal protein S18 acetylase RimI-like enzyme